MKVKSLLVLIIVVCCLTNAFAQEQKIAKEQANRIIEAYKRNARTFMNLEVCGDPYDGPVYILKQTENYSLDRLITISPQQEADLGLKMFHETQEANVVNNPKDVAMLRDMVAKLATVSSNPGRTYHVYIIKSDQINAFSTIGGYIYVTSALLNFVDTKDELAFVLGHEMSHILNGHVVRKIKKIAFLSNLGQKLSYQQFSTIALDLSMQLSAPFDQIDEYDADKSSLQLVNKAGYDETAFNAFFMKLERYDRKDLLSRFMSTHPSSANRRKCLNKLIAK